MMTRLDHVAKGAGSRRTLRGLFGSSSEAIAGVVAIEFAILGPLLALAIVGTIDLGLGIYRNMQVHNAAQAGAEYALTHGFSATGITNAITSATSFSGVSAPPQAPPAQFCGCPSAAGVSSAACGSTCPGGTQAGNYVKVSAAATYNTLIPYPLMPSSFVFSAQSTVRMQ